MYKEIKFLPSLIGLCCLGVIVIDFIWPGVFFNRTRGDIYLLGLITGCVNFLGYWLMRFCKSNGGYIYYGLGFLLMNLLVLVFWFWWMGVWVYVKWEVIVALIVVFGLINFIAYLLFRYNDKKENIMLK